ncbi:MAG: hypothetical protein ACOX6D_06070 [Thermoguttaceae bacterium]|jgi:hypothetical protein
MQNLLATTIISCVVFALFALALSLAALFGRRRKRRCACAESRIVMKTILDREKAKRAALLYRRDTVDPKSLPILSAEVAENYSPEQTSSPRRSASE